MEERSHITLLQLAERIRGVVQGGFSAPLWVSCEVSQLQSHSSGHCYLSLIDKGEGQSQPQAQIRATIWRSHYAAIAASFRSQTGYELSQGAKILALVGVTYHPSYGLSLQITDIDPTYTIGDMERVKRESIERLKAEGVWDMNRELGMPYAPQRIAIISSAGAAGYQDFCNQINTSQYHFSLTLFPATMQGESAEESIVAALESIAERMDDFDVVVVIRGGGSTIDMNCFNSYALCCNLAQFPLPIITGIGHQRDESVADMVAATALKTPTAVAVWLIERVVKVDQWLEDALRKISDCSREIIQTQSSNLNTLSGEITLLSRKFLDIEREKITMHHSQITHYSASLLREAEEYLSRAKEELKLWSNTLIKSEVQRLESLSSHLEAQSPNAILAMGFAIIERDGQAITSVKDSRAGEELKLRMRDGAIDVVVKGDSNKNE